MLHEDDVGVADGCRDALALAVVERQSVIVLVDRRAPVELERRLPGVDQRLALGHRQGGRMGHVRVEGGAGARQSLVQLRMDVEGRGLGGAVALDDMAMIVADEQRRRRDLGKGEAIGIDEEQVVIARHHGREVVADALVHAEQRRLPEARRKIDARRPHVRPLQVGRVAGCPRGKGMWGVAVQGVGHCVRSFRRV